MVKLPRNIAGLTDNEWESSTAESFGDMTCIQYPRTRLGMFDGVPVLFMEYVRHTGYNGTRDELGYEPDWIGCVDCGQVGMTRKNRLVVYDYGYM